MSFTPDAALVDEHRCWLARFDPQYRKNWEKTLANDAEAAMCEVAFRQMLEANGNRVFPSEDLRGAGRAPDFRCEQNGNHFYVEATVLRIEQVTKKTELPDKPTGEARYYRLLNDAIFGACTSKVTQCAGLDAPALLAVGTWHFSSSAVHIEKHQMAMLLTGRLGMAWSFDPESGSTVGEPEQVTQLWSSAFVQPGGNDLLVKSIRHPISGLLVAGFGTTPPRVLGVLHPEPRRPFNTRLLPKIEFCRLMPGYDEGNIAVEWMREID